MIEFLKDWVRDIFIIVTGSCFAEIVFPKGNMKKYLRYVFSLIVLGVVLSPVSYVTDGGFSAESFAEETEKYVSAFGDMQSEEDAEKLEKVQSVQLEEIYKNKIREETISAVNGYFPEIELYEVEVYLTEAGYPKEKVPAYLSKIVIKGEDTEYVNNIIRCVSQRLGIEDSMVSYEIPKEAHQNE